METRLVQFSKAFSLISVKALLKYMDVTFVMLLNASRGIFVIPSAMTIFVMMLE